MAPVCFWWCKWQWHNDIPKSPILFFCRGRWVKELKCVALLWSLWIVSLSGKFGAGFFKEKRRFLNCGRCCSHLEKIRHIKTCCPWKAKHYPRRWHNTGNNWGKWSIRLQCFWVKIIEFIKLSWRAGSVLVPPVLPGASERRFTERWVTFLKGTRVWGWILPWGAALNSLLAYQRLGAAPAKFTGARRSFICFNRKYDPWHL